MAFVDGADVGLMGMRIAVIIAIIFEECRLRLERDVNRNVEKDEQSGERIYSAGISHRTFRISGRCFDGDCYLGCGSFHF